MNPYEEQEYSKNFDLSLWKKLLRMAKPYRKNMLLLTMFMGLVALGDTIYPLLVRYAIDYCITPRSYGNVPILILLFAAFAVVQTFSIRNFIKQAGWIENNMVHDLRRTGYQKLQELSFSYYDTTAVGWIMARLTSDAQRIGDVLAWSFLDLVWAIVIIIFTIISMFILNARLALLVVAVIPFLAVITAFFQQKILKSHREIRKMNSRITGAYNEGIIGARTTKTLVREQKNFEEFGALTGTMRNASIRAALLSSVFLPIVITLGSIGAALVLTTGGRDVLQGTLSLGVLTVFINYVTQIFDPIRQLARLMSEFQSAQASAERTLQLIETQPDIVDAPAVVEAYGDAFHPKTENWPEIKGGIDFENVSFAYKTGEKVLEDFNLRVSPGEKIALVGETGAGKSTIVNLICRFYEPTSGRILIDGTDYRERAQVWLHSNLGYVLQSPHLFSGTVMENIRYGKLSATDEEVIQAAKMVNAYDFIQRLQHGFDTQVGEGGGRLSAGERQLISFARAILGDPRFFILDEPTSSVDTETEQTLLTAIDRVLEGRTSFIVAHRLSTISSCDRILVIQDGKIIEAGNHKRLLQNKGNYYRLYTNQFKREAADKLLQEG